MSIAPTPDATQAQEIQQMPEVEDIEAGENLAPSIEDNPDLDPMTKLVLGGVENIMQKAGSIAGGMKDMAVSAGLAIGVLQYTNNAPTVSAPTTSQSAPLQPNLPVNPQQADLSPTQVTSNAMQAAQGLTSEALAAVQDIGKQMQTRMNEFNLTPESPQHVSGVAHGEMVANVQQDLSTDTGMEMHA